MIGERPAIAVIGGGQAAARLIEHLRDAGCKDRIVLIGEEDDLPYERPDLSKGVLTGRSQASDLEIHNRAFYDQAGVDVRLSTRAVRLDVNSRSIHLSSGDSLKFDTCVLATGARVRRVLDDAVVPGVLTLRHGPDARSLQPLLVPGRNLLVLGGGFLGLEAATSARTAGADVTVLEAGPRLLARVLPSELAADIQARHERMGTRILTGDKLKNLTRITSDSRGVYMAELESGKTLFADVVLESVGCLPNDDLARQAGLAVSNGIICDAQCRTSNPGIFAIGDCAAVFNDFEGASVRYESWQAAETHARIAAAAILGEADRYDEVPWFWTDQAGANLQMLGRFPAEGKIVMRKIPDKDAWIGFGLSNDDAIVAAALMNCGKFRRGVTDLIRRRVVAEPALLADPAIPLSDTIESAHQHSR